MIEKLKILITHLDCHGNSVEGNLKEKRITPLPKSTKTCKVRTIMDDLIR